MHLLTQSQRDAKTVEGMKVSSEHLEYGSNIETIAKSDTLGESEDFFRLLSAEKEDVRKLLDFL
jgi:hypothetical protein